MIIIRKKRGVLPPAAAAQPFSQKSVRVFVVVWAQGPFSCDVLVLKREKSHASGVAPFLQKK